MSKISYSAWRKYMTCPKLYDYHYNERLRPTTTSSALMFGVAMDEALNHLLEGGDEPVLTFQQFFEFEDMEGIEWDPRDWTPWIMEDEQFARLEGCSSEYRMWACMRVKGRMLIDAYKQVVLPKIKEIIHVQKDTGDRPGFIDAVVDLDGDGRVLIDHKTSARPYRPDSVVYDTQLALYAHSQGLEKAGFIVLRKDMPKSKSCSSCGFDGAGSKHQTCPNKIDGARCHGNWTYSVNPKDLIQIIVSPVPQLNKDLIEESISQVETAIQHKIFPRNLTACGKMFGKPCPYIDKCWKNSDNGLEKREKTNVKG